METVCRGTRPGDWQRVQVQTKDLPSLFPTLVSDASHVQAPGGPGGTNLRFQVSAEKVVNHVPCRGRPFKLERAARGYGPGPVTERSKSGEKGQWLGVESTVVGREFGQSSD